MGNTLHSLQLMITYISFLRVQYKPPLFPVSYYLSSLVEPSFADVGCLLRDTTANVERGGGMANPVTFLGELNHIILLLYVKVNILINLTFACTHKFIIVITKAMKHFS